MRLVIRKQIVDKHVHRLVFSLLLTFFIANPVNGQKIQRYQSAIFAKADSVLNIPYGEAVNMKGNAENLLLDLYTPAGVDTVNGRPLLIFIHGGGFQNGNKSGAFSRIICNGMAQRGYVVATIDYRLGISGTKTDADYFEAMYRAVQDGKAAVRFFRRYATKYGIDTSQIFMMGSSAGAKTAMHLAYMDQAEVPSFIDVKKMGTLEGNSGNEGYSSKVQGVINCWGAMVNDQWINQGDQPMFHVSGTADKTVPFDSSFSYHGFRYGSSILYDRLLSLGIPTGYRPFYNTGHTLDNNKIKQDSALLDIAQWLFTRLNQHKPDKPEVFKWEEEILQLEKLDTKEAYSNNAILFIGSSYIRLWAHMKTELSPFETINRGFGGSKLSDVAYYIKRLAYPHNCQAIVLYVGNDITGTNLDKTPLQVIELVKYITNKIREKYPTTPICWNQISPSEKRWAVWNSISEANNLIKNYCEQNIGLHYIQIAERYLGKDGTPITKLFREDKLHYNDAGYSIWADIMKNKLIEKLKK